MRIRVCVLLLVLGLVLTVAEKNTKKHEAKSLAATPTQNEKGASKLQTITESKPEKRGAHGVQENLGPFQEDGGGTAVGQAGLQTEVSHHRPIVTEKVVHAHVPVPHPYPVEYIRHVPYPVKVPVPVVVHKPFPVPIPSPVHVTVENKVPFPVVRHVPYHVKAPVELLANIPVDIPVPEQHTVPVSKTVDLPLPQSDIKHVPFYIAQHPDNQEIHKTEVHKGTRLEESGPTSHVNIPEAYDYVKSSYIHNTRLPEAYKEIIPAENYIHFTLPESHRHQLPPKYHQSITAQAYHHEENSPRGCSHEFDNTGSHEAGLGYIGYLSHGHGAAGHGLSYQSLITH